MNEAPTGSTASRSTVRYLRLPLLLVTGLLTMGSGMGNPGCGGGSSDDGGEPGTHCEQGCTVEGTWQLSYSDMSPLPPECTEAGVTLPSGPLEIRRSGSDVTLTAGSVVVTGNYYGSTIYLSLGDTQPASASGASYYVGFIGDLSKIPETAQEPLTWKGNLYLSSEAVPERPCRVNRAFTATR